MQNFKISTVGGLSKHLSDLTQIWNLGISPEVQRNSVEKLWLSAQFCLLSGADGGPCAAHEDLLCCTDLLSVLPWRFCFTGLIFKYLLRLMGVVILTWGFCCTGLIFTCWGWWVSVCCLGVFVALVWFSCTALGWWGSVLCTCEFAVSVWSCWGQSELVIIMISHIMINQLYYRLDHW